MVRTRELKCKIKSSVLPNQKVGQQRIQNKNLKKTELSFYSNFVYFFITPSKVATRLQIFQQEHFGLYNIAKVIFELWSSMGGVLLKEYEKSSNFISMHTPTYAYAYTLISDCNAFVWEFIYYKPLISVPYKVCYQETYHIWFSNLQRKYNLLPYMHIQTEYKLFTFRQRKNGSCDLYIYQLPVSARRFRSAVIVKPSLYDAMFVYMYIYI